MFQYLNSIILKCESNDKQKQSNTNKNHVNTHSDKTNKNEKHKSKQSDPFLQRTVFPMYLDHETGDKMTNETQNSHKSKQFPIYPPMDPEKKLDWKTFIPSNWPKINTENNKNDNKITSTSLDSYPTIDFSDCD